MTFRQTIPNMKYLFSLWSRYLDDVSLHHLINALCSLSLEAMEMAYGNNKVKTVCILLLGETDVLHIFSFDFG